MLTDAIEVPPMDKLDDTGPFVLAGQLMAAEFPYGIAYHTRRR